MNIKNIIKMGLFAFVLLVDTKLPAAIIRPDVGPLAFHPNGNILATVSIEGLLKLLNLTTKKSSIREINIGYTKTLTFSHDGEWLATTDDSGSVTDTHTVKLWNLTSMTLRHEFICPGRLKAVAFSRDGKTLATAQDNGEISFFNLTTGTLIQTLIFKDFRPEALAFNPDENLIAAIHDEKTINIWKLTDKTMTCIHSYSMYITIKSVAFNPCGTHLMYILRDFEISGHGTPPDHKDFTLSLEKLGVLNLITGSRFEKSYESLYNIDVPYSRIPNTVKLTAISHDGSQIAIKMADGEIKFLRTNSSICTLL